MDSLRSNLASPLAIDPVAGTRSSGTRTAHRNQDRPVLAYIAGKFPARSETFVYREIRELRFRGWTVHCVTLHASPDTEAPEFSDLNQGLTTLYGRAGVATFARALKEHLQHPISTAKLITMAMKDALYPREKLSILSRIKLIAQASAALGLSRHLRALGVTHIHAHFAHAPASVAMYVSRHMGVSFSFTGHANDLFQRRALLGRKLSRAMFVSCISEWHRQYYSTIKVDLLGKYHVIRCGVDVTSWKPKMPRRFESGVLHVLTVCRLVEKKGVDTLIYACHELGTRRGTRWKLTIAGDGPDRARLAQIAESIGASAHIEWLGAVQNELVPQLLGKCDVFALPCRVDANGDKDGVPVVLMEAMACGVPAISGDLPAIRELIDHGQDGLFVGANEWKLLADHLQRLDEDEPERQRLGAAGRARVETEFSLSMNVGRLEEALLNKMA